jgi:menaquinone-specific isochorismate synthase
MTPQDENQFFKSFLKSGALFRRGESEWLAMVPANDEDGLNKSPEYSLSYQNFFESQLQTFGSDLHVKKLSTSELASGLSKVIHDPAAELGSQKFKAGISLEGFRATPLSVFTETMQIIQGKIHRGEIEKAVPAIFFNHEGAPSASDLMNWIVNLSKAPISMTVYGFWDSNFGILGATPEILFHRDGNIIRSMALAGTCPKSETSQRVPLLKDAKEMHEHNLVVHDIEARLKTWGWVQKSATRILELPTLLHLMTELQVETSAKTDAEIVKLLHPTPALGVAPRAYGYCWLQDLPEQKQRQLFGGPIVFKISKSESIGLVAIRNIQWTPRQSWVSTGCGIVAASETEREWRELEQKKNSIFSLLGIR